MKMAAIVTVLALTACGDKGDSAAEFVPTEGNWSYTGLAYDSDECGLEASFSPAALEAIVWTMSLTDGGMELSTTAADPVLCELDGMDFTCDVMLLTDVTEWPKGSSNKGDPDVTTTSEGLVTGVFSDEETSTLSFTVTRSCEGADCDAYLTETGASSPCTTSMSTGFVYTGE